MTVDHFASYKNSKCSRFNSKYLCVSTDIVNNFCQDCSNEANWLVPPIYLKPKCLTGFALSACVITGIVMLPCWTSAKFWLRLFEKESRVLGIICDALYLPRTVVGQVDYDGSNIQIIIFKSQLSNYTKIFLCVACFIEFIDEHLIPHIDINDSCLNKLLCDHAPFVIQKTRRVNAFKSYRMYFSKWKLNGEKDLKKWNHYQHRTSMWVFTCLV